MTVSAIDAFARAGLAPDARSMPTGFASLMAGAGQSDATRRAMDWIAETHAHLARQAEDGAPRAEIAATEKLLAELNKLLVVRMMGDALFGAQEDDGRSGAAGLTGAVPTGLDPAALGVLAGARDQ